MTLEELWQAVETGRGTPDWNANRAALHNRFVTPLSILVIPFLATPFGFMSKRTGRAFGLAAGFALLLLYNKVIEFGEALAALGAASPWVTLWGPLVLFAAGVAYLYRQSAFKVGANPFAWLEALWDGLHALYSRIFSPAGSQT